MVLKNYNQSVKINHNTNWPYIPVNTWRILIIAGSGPGKPNPLLNLIKNQQPDIDKVYLQIHSYERINYLVTKEKK